MEALKVSDVARRGATWRDVARRGATWRGAEYGKLVQKSSPENLTLLNLLRRRRASPEENPRTRLDVLRQHDGGYIGRGMYIDE